MIEENKKLSAVNRKAFLLKQVQDIFKIVFKLYALDNFLKGDVELFEYGTNAAGWKTYRCNVRIISPDTGRVFPFAIFSGPIVASFERQALYWLFLHDTSRRILRDTTDIASVTYDIMLSTRDIPAPSKN